MSLLSTGARSESTTGVQRRPGTRVIVSAALVAVAGLLAFVPLSSLDTDARVVAASLALALFLLALLLLIDRSRGVAGLFDLRLGSWMIAYGAVIFGIASITPPTLYEGEWVLPRDRIPAALLLIAIVFVAFFCGYLLGAKGPLAIPIAAGMDVLGRARSQEVRSTLVLHGVFALGVGADAVMALIEGRFGYIGDATLVTSESAGWYEQPLQIISALKLAALFGLSLRAFAARGARAVVILMPALGVAFALGLASGMKENFLTIALPVLVAFVIVRGKIPAMSIMLIALVFTLVVTPFVTQLRDDVRSASGNLDITDALRTAGQQLVAQDGYLSDVDPAASAMQVLGRLRMVDNLVLISEKTPEMIPYRPLEELFTAPFAGAIPRAVWPDKPVRLTGYDFYVTYYGGQGQSSSALTFQGSLYLYGGIPVLIAGMLIMGVAVRALDDGARARSNRHGALLFIVLAPTVVKQELDIASLLAGTVVYGLTFVLSALLVFRGVPRGTRETRVR